MKISSSMVDLYAQSRSRETITYEEKSLLPKEDPSVPSFTDATQGWLEEARSPSPSQAVGKVEEKVYELSEEDYQKIKMLEKILSALTGKRIKFVLPKAIRAKGRQVEPAPTQQVLVPYKKATLTYEHRQSLEFKASGKVSTEDGRQIQFDLSLLSKSSTKIHREEVFSKMQTITDPLALTYDGSLPSLTKEKYQFDLDFDGSADQISFLSKGSGFLSIDRNDNGKIDDGRELFGPESGNGFSELARYDQDGNGWIDENDPIFDQLRLWEKNEQGEDVLLALGEVGVGAIYLGHVATDYVLGGSPLSKDGQLSGAGIFLKESGQVGTVTHVDLAL